VFLELLKFEERVGTEWSGGDDADGVDADEGKLEDSQRLSLFLVVAVVVVPSAIVFEPVLVEV
jgi:hypothetical protein